MWNVRWQAVSAWLVFITIAERRERTMHCMLWPRSKWLVGTSASGHPTADCLHCTSQSTCCALHRPSMQLTCRQPH